VSAYQKLHPAIRHHIKDSLGWPALQPEQLAAIEAILANQDCLLLPFASGGELEGAVFPLLSRMISESWGGTSALYVCPMKAQLDYVEPRLAAYLAVVGRRAAVWHGEVSRHARRELLKSPPDLLLTTPESLDQMLMARKGETVPLLAAVRTVIVAELAAFAGDDRGWHLRATLARLGALGRRPPQLIALSACLANPDELIRWLTGSAAAVCIGQAAGPAEADVEIEHAGSLAGAASAIAQAHAGQKRLVFCDSDAQVEELVRALRKLGTRVFASQASLSATVRRAAENAFVQEHDCVIVATGSLDLGAELGDVDRVIHIDAPATVSSFLNRMARSGRRPGSRHNCLFLTLRPEGLLLACAQTRLWRARTVEGIKPPPAPWHVVLQQLWALLLEHGALPAHELVARLEKAFPELACDDFEELLQHLQSTDILREHEGRLAPGRAGERCFGRRHFRALTSVFMGGSPDFLVRHGRREIGYVTPSVLLPEESGPAMVSLAGQDWRVQSVDWRRRRAAVAPPENCAVAR